ncbi:MAG TPA: acyclic terpene utilization AtuA family protein, partial [Polyangia bacterium]
MNDILRIANCSGFWGDRFEAAAEMVRGGPIDVLTGDYLAELTMAILYKSRQKRGAGFVPTFLAQLEEVLGECLDRKIRVVSNAGGLDPRGLAEEIEKLAARLGLHPKVAWVDGDDLAPRLDALAASGEPLTHLDRKIALASSGARVLTANAYLGGFGIAEALARGADIVVTGRVTDAALVVGPSVWRFGWKRDDWDRLAGAVSAGHVIECSAQATGGNYPFLDEIPSHRRIGFPVAELREDGSFVITKHPGTGGRVSIGTVTAQLLYEIQGPRYLNPDVTARFDTLTLSDDGPDRVLVSGARGEPPPDTLKVCINHAGGFRNSMTVLLGGLDLVRKAELVTEALFDALGGRDQFEALAAVDVRLERMDHPDPQSNED